MGRKSKYETHVAPYLKEIPHWYEDMTEGQIAKKLGVTSASFENYKKKHKELIAALKKGKQYLADELKDALRKKAKGFSYTEVKTKEAIDKDGKLVTLEEKYERYSPPDVGAIHLLLKNIDENWRNDDAPTMKLKQETLDLKKARAEEDIWT